MKRMPFEPPTEYYNERIEATDQQICKLIKQRKELSNNNPGFPTKLHISAWSEENDLYEDFLNSIFAHFLNEDMYKPLIEPKRFIKNIPILKSFEKDNVFYAVTFVRQFENASVVHFNIDREIDENAFTGLKHEHNFFALSIKGSETDYECQNDGGGGSRGHNSYTYTISPSLPDDMSNLKMVFKEYKVPYQKPTGFEIEI